MSSAAHPSSRRFGFVMELQAGMRTVYQNWRSVVEQDATICAAWAPITYRKEGGRIERTPGLPPSIRAALRSRAEIDAGLGRRQYDAVLFNTYNPAVTYRAAMRRQPSYIMFDVTPTQYDAMAHWYGHRPDRIAWLRRLKAGAVTSTLRGAAGLFAWSRWAAESAIANYGADPKRVTVLPPGVDTRLWSPEPDKRRGRVQILFVGYAFERKGGDLLLRWAAETRMTGWELHLVTSSSLTVQPPIFVHNDLSANSLQLVTLVRQCDLFVLPTRADCFSLASIEAMSAGLPVITTRVGGIPDIVQDGETGYLVEPNDYESLKRVLDELVGSRALRQRMGDAGRERALQRFDAYCNIRTGLRLMMEGCS